MKNLPESPASASTEWRYTAPARVLHWLVAPLLVVMATLGWYMMSIEKLPGSGWYFDLHKSLGLVAFSLILLRLFWRLSHTPQPLPQRVPAWQVQLSRWTHRLLYLLMIAVPCAGILGALFSEDGLAWFGMRLPRPMANHDLSELFFSIHGVLIWSLIGVVVLHVAGALKHVLIDRDGVFRRMGW